MTVSPGASEADLGLVLVRLIVHDDIDLSSVRAAWKAAQGVPVKVTSSPASSSPPTSQSVATRPLPLDEALRTEERDGEVWLTVDPRLARVAESDLLGWLNRSDYSGLSLELVRVALNGPRGVAHRITAIHSPAEPAAALVSASTIVIADHDPSFRTRAGDALRRRGFANVLEAANGDLALFHARQSHADLLFLSHPMRQENALALCDRIRSDRHLSRLPVIMILASPTRETVIDAVKAGASEILVRPFSADSLFLKLERALRQAGKRLPAASASGATPRPAETQVKTLGKIDLEKLRARVQKMHALPAVVERVLQLTTEDDSTTRELSKCIESDSSMATTLLRAANSVYYGAQGAIADVLQAIVRIGFRQVRSLITGMGVMRVIPRTTQAVGFDRAAFWRHSLATATLARLLCKRMNVSQDTAYLSGLLHDIGKIFLDEYAAGEFEQAVLRALKEGIPLCQAERDVLQTTHTEVGGAVLEAWRFPAEIVAVVRSHHKPSRNLGPELLRPCIVVTAANLLSKAAGAGHAGDLLLEEPEQAAALGLEQGMPDGIWSSFAMEMRETEEFLGLRNGATARTVCAKGALWHESGCPALLLQTVLTSAGSEPVLVSDPDAIASVPEKPAYAVARCRTAQKLADVIKSWAALPALAGCRIAGVLPRDESWSGEGTVFVEPYDRSVFLRALGLGPSE